MDSNPAHASHLPLVYGTSKRRSRTSTGTSKEDFDVRAGRPPLPTNNHTMPRHNHVAATQPMEEVDLTDNHSLIQMADLYSTTKKASATASESADDTRHTKDSSSPTTTSLPPTSPTSTTPAPISPTGPAAVSDSLVVATIENGAANMGGPAALASSNSKSHGGSSKAGGGHGPPGRDGERVSCTRRQALFGSIFLLGLLVAALLITYVVTRNAMEKKDLHAYLLRGHPFAEAEAYRDEYSTSPPPSPPQIMPSADENGTNVEGSSSTANGNGGPSAEELRLSRSLHPLWYNLTMKIYVPGFVPVPTEKNLRFDAALLLKFVVRNATDVIELNALKLDFGQNLGAFELLKEEGNSSITAIDTLTNTKSTPSSILTEELSGQLVPSGFKITKLVINETVEKVFFHLDTPLPEGEEYFLKIPYSGPIAKKLSGLYLTHYTTQSTGEDRYAAVTQMEATDARRMVPCFDEPEFKAVWRLSVFHPRGSSAVSNAIERSEKEKTDDADWLRTTFEDTLPMSSYLLALVVSDFEYVEGYTNRKTRFRIWARSDAINLTSYALESGIKVLEYFEDYYNISFPLPKQDMMAFPDFAAGAMENWGLVTYREKYLLYSPELYTPQQKMAVASVVSHELAHQWFGNLVTMKWWSDLWLNEGFATLMEYAGTDAISQGDFRMNEYFLIEALDSAFDRDARATSHPLFFEIQKAEDVSEAFDSITYSKGASVLRMIRSVMGEENFRRGLNIYLNRYKYRNAEHSDLWDALTEAVPSNLTDWSGGAPLNIGRFAEPWTNQMGYPVVEVHRIDEHRVRLTQKRFKLDESALERPKFRNAKYWYKWDVPLWWTVNGSERPMEWLHESRELNVEEGEVLTVNSESLGYYRVQYSKRTLDPITDQLLTDHERISVRTRARIIDDTFTLAEASRLPYEAALNLTRYLQHEKEYLPWEMAFTGLAVIQNYFGDEPEADHFRDYVKHIIDPIFEQEIGKVVDGSNDAEKGGFFESLLNMRVIQKMCSLRDMNCINNITTIYRTHFVEPCFTTSATSPPSTRDSRNTSQSASTLMSSQCSRVPVTLRTLTYCEGVHYGSERDWERMLDLFEKEEVQVERERLMTSLACSRDTHTLKKLLAMAADINNTAIRLQDKPSVFGHVSSRVIGQKVIVDFFIDHWPQIYTDFKEQQTLLRSIIAHSLVGNSQRVIDEVEHFIDANVKTTRNLDVFKQRLEVMKTNKKWMERNFTALSEWFRKQNERRQPSPQKPQSRARPHHGGGEEDSSGSSSSSSDKSTATLLQS